MLLNVEGLGGIIFLISPENIPSSSAASLVASPLPSGHHVPQSILPFFPSPKLTVLVRFCYCDKIPEIINLKRGKVCSGPWFQRFWSMFAWPAVGIPVEDNCLSHGNQEAKRGRGSGLLFIFSPDDITFLILNPTF